MRLRSYVEVSSENNENCFKLASLSEKEKICQTSGFGRVLSNGPISIFQNSAANNRPQDKAPGNYTVFVGFIPQSLVLRSIVYGWILNYQNWPILRAIAQN